MTSVYVALRAFLRGCDPTLRSSPPLDVSTLLVRVVMFLFSLDCLDVVVVFTPEN